MKPQIIPTIFAISKKEFDKKFKTLTPLSKKIQIDFMDKKFVTNKSVKLSDIPNLKNFDNEFEAHLMIHNPKTWIKRLKNKGFQKVIFHYETLTEKEIPKLINEIQKLDMQAFLAINPKTREEKTFPFLKHVDGIMIMGVTPGGEHQRILRKTYYKIQNLREKSKSVIIQIDGGVNSRTAPYLVKDGANILNSGSYISKNKNPKEALEYLKSVI
tara:strand:- start:2254 stop:2895 length:642 start_codon:yes stop_codon:yes gene_type:complete